MTKEKQLQENTESKPDETKPVENPKARWYVVHTYSGHEKLLREAVPPP